MQNLSGIPILLTFKVTPANGYAIPTKFSVNTPQEISRYQTTLQTFLEETFDYITAEIAATFKQKTDLEQYFISFTKIISKPGHDTKYTIKPFLKYLDSEKQLSLQINGTKFSVGLTSRMLIWHEVIGEPRSILVSFKTQELDTNNPDMMLVHLTNQQSLVRPYQIFSPLLFCIQMQLKETEILEKDGFVAINIASPKFSVPYYYHVNATEVRVCVDHYFRILKSDGSTIYIFPQMFVIYIYTVYVFNIP